MAAAEHYRSQHGIVQHHFHTSLRYYTIISLHTTSSFLMTLAIIKLFMNQGFVVLAPLRQIHSSHSNTMVPPFLFS